jgi:hypothetical protein
MFNNILHVHIVKGGPGGFVAGLAALADSIGNGNTQVPKFTAAQPLWLI